MRLFSLLCVPGLLTVYKVELVVIHGGAELYLQIKPFDSENTGLIDFETVLLVLAASTWQIKVP